MHRQTPLDILALTFATCSLCGCVGNTDDVIRTPHDVKVKSVSVDAAPIAPSDAPHLDLPFPNRTNPFSTHHQSGEGTTVDLNTTRLCGIVEMGEAAKAVILKDGQAHILLVGESIDGLAIVAINPPFVELSQNGRTWTESLDASSGEVGGKPKLPESLQSGLKSATTIPAT